jgi:hypothetical protein
MRDLTPEELEYALQRLALHQFILKVIAEISVPVALCECPKPTVGPPNDRDWCECTSCHKSVSMIDVVEGKAIRTLNA